MGYLQKMKESSNHTEARRFYHLVMIQVDIIQVDIKKTNHRENLVEMRIIEDTTIDTKSHLLIITSK